MRDGRGDDDNNAKRGWRKGWADDDDENLTSRDGNCQENVGKTATSATTCHNFPDGAGGRSRNWLFHLCGRTCTATATLTPVFPRRMQAVPPGPSWAKPGLGARMPAAWLGTGTRHSGLFHGPGERGPRRSGQVYQGHSWYTSEARPLVSHVTVVVIFSTGNATEDWSTLLQAVAPLRGETGSAWTPVAPQRPDMPSFVQRVKVLCS
jgi:hypothetical protein